MPKVTAAAAALLLALGLAGCGASAGMSGDSGEPKQRSQSLSDGSAENEPTPGADGPLVAETPTEGEEDPAAFVEFVRARQATFPTQIPNATDAQLITAGQDACDRLRSGESPEMMTLIEGEELSGEAGYYYDSNAIIAGAQLNLCPDTIEDTVSGDTE